MADEAFLSGSGERREQAADRQMRYFQRHPTDSDRDYFYDFFHTVQTLPAVAGLFDGSHNPIWVYGISGDAAKALIDFWRRPVPETDELVHDFTDESWDMRFLGDIYQDLSEEAPPSLCTSCCVKRSRRCLGALNWRPTTRNALRRSCTKPAPNTHGWSRG